MQRPTSRLRSGEERGATSLVDRDPHSCLRGDLVRLVDRERFWDRGAVDAQYTRGCGEGRIQSAERAEPTLFV